MADLARALVVAHKSDKGLKRQVNEDFCEYHVPKRNTQEARFGALFVVADGVGSMGSGEHASRAATETVLSTYYDSELEDDDPRERLIASVQDANEAVRARSRSLSAAKLGTTLAGAVILESGRLYVFNVGDSRVYRLRGRTITPLTTDHSAVDPADADARSKLTAYVGQAGPVLPSVREDMLENGDILIICSDGLWGLVDAAEIAAIVARHSLPTAADRLVEQVYRNGARDNVTVVLVHYGPGRRRFRDPILMLVAAVLILSAAAAVKLWAQAQEPITELPPTLTVESTVEPSPASALAVPDATQDASALLIVRTPTVAPN